MPYTPKYDSDAIITRAEHAAYIDAMAQDVTKGKAE